ncbi:hypothetical protein DY000_02018696 [Brassica cretica]|uniref:Uncharacterized protein n=1 Tax=Brassica cretica TaxID=69181 RepID=A0ABQ7D3Y1_BRACR|nr:hypothetical protein DY000_02018696 [Brassica cretica]
MGAPDLRAVALIAGDVNVRGCIQFIEDTSGPHSSRVFLSFENAPPTTSRSFENVITGLRQPGVLGTPLASSMLTIML